MYEKHDETEQLAPFNFLSEELTDNIRTELQDNRLSHNMFAFTCRTFYRLAKAERLRARLADCLIERESLEIQHMLTRYPQLLVKRGLIIDKSIRIFEECSVWEYILWALDVKFMGPMMVDCLPYDEQGKQIALQLLAQLEHHEQHGITYLLNGKDHCESHYDFSILAVLQTFVTNFNSWEWHEQINFWKKDMRRAQLYAPTHIAQHYCAPEAFNGDTLSHSLTFLHPITKQNEPWWTGQPIEEIVEKSEYAVIKGAKECTAVNYMRGTYTSAHKDLTELTILKQTRLTNDLPALKQKLIDFIKTFDMQCQSANIRMKAG
ncbi:hypothetical protein [Legionella fallonii]|uniref:Uncharacterized protein n=1 Tax=Legionella fallonii LLAP-10 TaxID=1212491 RepID=A0A098FZV8_9GAMM|nr:hypothetical protein [Legionella fallonii]CEG55763.1 conserved protein of unknown function [coiled-coil domain] [Legionella fallonii LLAP-10]